MIDEGGGVGDQIFESNSVKLYVDPISIAIWAAPKSISSIP